MRKSSLINTRIETKLKMQAEFVLRELGITPTQAVRMLYKAIAREHALPLTLKIPNRETQQVLDETDHGVDIISCKNFEDFCKQTGIES